jgi:hypothetical protein
LTSGVLRPAALLLTVVTLAASCAGVTSGNAGNAKPADLFAIMPSQAGIRTLMGDGTWWAGAPSFEVRPLDAETTPATEKFSVSQPFIHLGTAEELFARYTVFDKTSSATTTMTDYQTAFGTSPLTPKVGDQVLYYGLGGSGGAPYLYRTFVRVGQVVLTVLWARKDRGVTVQMLAGIAKKFADPMRNISKVHAAPAPVPAGSLPPPGMDITLLGATKLPVEAFVVMSRTALPDYVQGIMTKSGVSTFPYGDYALNNDTHMEVQTGLFTLGNTTDADAWAKAFGASQDPDPDGIYMGYIPTGGTPAAGVYVLTFAQGQYGGFLTCKSSIDGEAASRECETPVHNTAVAWKIALSGA